MIYFHLLFSKGKYWLMFTEQRSPFLITIGEMDFFSIIILFCIIGYCVSSVSKGNNKYHFNI